MNAPLSSASARPPGVLHPQPACSAEDRARADHYALIARLFFAAPDAPLLEAIVATGEALGRGEGELARAWAALAEAARSTDAQAARAEYEALFHAISRPEVMLYGSFYIAGFLMEEPLADLRADLAALGLSRRFGVAESEDHIAALSEAMRHLVLAAPDGEGVARQKAFFMRHLQPWYGRLADALAAAPGASFYARAGALARAFFDIESEAFTMH